MNNREMSAGTAYENSTSAGSFFVNRYRVVEDSFAGYEAQIKFWWFPIFWFEMWANDANCNTWAKIEDAIYFIKYASKRKFKLKRKVYWES